MTKVSIIIPVYNCEQYLRECLDSVVGQTLKEIEILCVDNNSSDSSLSILKEYETRDSRVKVYREPTAGSAYARNLGLEHACGEYIGFADADDYIDSNYFEVLYRLAKEHGADMTSTSNVIKFNENGPLNRKNTGIQGECLCRYKEKSEVIYWGGMVWNHIFRRDFLTRYEIHFPAVNSTGQDNYFSAQSIIYADKIVTTDSVAYHYRNSSQSAAHRVKTEKNFGIVEIYRQTDDRIRSSPFLSESEKEEWLCTMDRRKIMDLCAHYKTMRPDLKKKFLKLADGTFPEIHLKRCLAVKSFKRKIVNPLKKMIKKILN